MGLKSKILKGLAIGGAGLGTILTAGAASPAIAAALGIGGATSGALGAGATALSPILSKAAANQSQSKILKNTQNAAQDRAALERFKTNEALPAERLNTGVRASRVASATPVSVDWGGPGSGLRGEMTHFNGGYANPNLVGADTRQQAQEVAHQMLLKQMQGPTGEAPALTPLATEGVGDKILGGAALGTSILGALAKRRQPLVPGQMPNIYDGTVDPNSADPSGM